ncbi:maleylpyruvate isomerase family mycothiol-dependent enzyme [Streptomyces sp. NPDC051940]|uniref:maleylpyruvate isomerase family mycothiol-dependent enzyme n=1 Tax=Streptomyces sp. NPDC051940 TaxID=3155675 RepID=UPI003415E817
MPQLDHERCCAEIIEQTRLLRETLDGADLSVRVPTCPDWTLRELAVHVGGAHRWAAETVKRRSQTEIPDEDVPGFYGPEAADGLDAWLAEGAELLATALREAGPSAEVWTWAAEKRSGFWARRMTHETVVHRADAAGAASAAYTVAPDVAADTVDEWLEILGHFGADDRDPTWTALRSKYAGSSLHLHATDAPGAEWLIEVGEDGFTWTRTHAKATVALRGPLADVLRVFYRRLPTDAPEVEVLGEQALLGAWLAWASWGGGDD